jgi:HEAT repeat protein
MHKFLFIAILCLVSSVGLRQAQAKKKGKSARAAKAEVKQTQTKEVADAISGLSHTDPEKVLSSIGVLAASGAKGAAAPLVDLLRTGPRNDITNAAIQSLGLIAHPESLPVIIEYLNHRRPDARITAIYALDAYEDEKVAAALTDALRDSDKEVRSTAALSLGKHGNVSTVPILFKALDRGVQEAAISIGQLGTAKHAEKLSAQLGKLDINILLPGFDEFLRREDFPKKGKLQILNDLFELAGPDVRRFAVAYKASFPPGTTEENELFKMVSRMVRRIQED